MRLLGGAGGRDVFEKVLLAVDGSKYSAKAVPVAAEIAKKDRTPHRARWPRPHSGHRQAVNFATDDVGQAHRLYGNECGRDL